MLNGERLARSGCARSALLVLVVFWVACGDDSSTAAPQGDAGLLGIIEGAPPVGDFDATVEEEPPADSSVPIPDAGPEDSATPESDAAISPSDATAAISGVVLTNAPHIGFTNQGTAGLVITSAAFWTTEVENDLAFVNMFGDVENQGDEFQCITTSDLFAFDGGLDELVVIEADPHRSLSSSITSPTDCIPPGGRGVWHGILLDMPVDFIENARQVRYAFRGQSLFDDFVPHELTPQVLFADPVMRELGYTVFGLIRTADMPIYNMSITFFARHRNGLLFDTTNAYPGDLATLAPMSSVLYESFVFDFSDELPDSVTYIVDFLDGTDPTPNTQLVYDPLPSGELGEQIARAARAKRENRAARERAKALLHR